MDPLSIAASAITLIQAAGLITTGLRRMNQSVKTAESRITGLCDELSNLTSYLEAVERTLKGCKTLDLACMDDYLWERIEVALADCQTTLNELGGLVEKLKDGTRARGIAWRPRVALDLSLHGPDIVAFKDRLHKSNWALQTMLQAITVAASMRNHASQAVLLWELQCLKATIEDSRKESSRPARGHSRVAQNLRHLAEAADHFHSAASSTASTMSNGSMASPSHHSQRASAHAAMSIDGRIPEYKRDWVERYISGAARQGRASRARCDTPLCQASWMPNSIPAPAPQSVLGVVGTMPGVEAREQEPYLDSDSSDDEEEFERIIPDGFEDLAGERIKGGNFEQAICFLEEALAHARASPPDARRLQVKLALCHFLQGTWRQAEPIVCLLASTPSSRDPIVCNLLHALSLAYLEAYSPERALVFCEQALKGKKRWLKRSGAQWEESREYADTLGLLAKVSERSGDHILAEIYRRKLPRGYLYRHPWGPFWFFREQPELLRSVFGDDVPDLRETDAPLMRQMNPMNPMLSWRPEWERLELDTAKIVVSGPDSAICMDGDDDMVSTPTTTGSLSPSSSLKRRLSRTFSPGRRRRHEDSPTSPLGNDDVDGSQSPVIRWLKGQGKTLVLRRSRALLRKLPHSPSDSTSTEGRNERSFRLLRMEKMVLPDDASPGIQRKVLFSEDLGYSSEVSVGQESGSFHGDGFGATSSGGLAELPVNAPLVTGIPSSEAYGAADRCHYPVAHPSEPSPKLWTHTEYEYWNCVPYVEPTKDWGRPLDDETTDGFVDARCQYGITGHYPITPSTKPRGTELARFADYEYRNGVLYVEPTKARRKPLGTKDANDTVHALRQEGIAELHGDSCPAEKIMEKQQLYALGFFSTYSLLLPFSAYIQGFSTSYLAVPDKGSASISAEEAIIALFPTISSSLDSLNVPRIRTPHPGKAIDDPTDTQPFSRQHLTPAEGTRKTQADDLGTTLTILASIVASLSRPKEPHVRLLIMLKLKAISARLARLSDDPLLIGDVQRIIESLGDVAPEERVQPPEKDAETRTESNGGGGHEKSTPPDLDEEVPADRPVKSQRPVLSRADSWAPGDERRLWRKREVGEFRVDEGVRTECAKDRGSIAAPDPDGQARGSDCEDGVDEMVLSHYFI